MAPTKYSFPRFIRSTGQPLSCTRQPFRATITKGTYQLRWVRSHWQIFPASLLRASTTAETAIVPLIILTNGPALNTSLGLPRCAHAHNLIPSHCMRKLLSEVIVAVQAWNRGQTAAQGPLLDMKTHRSIPSASKAICTTLFAGSHISCSVPVFVLREGASTTSSQGCR